MGEGALQALAAAGLKKEDIDFFIPHQANIRIIESAAKMCIRDRQQSLSPAAPSQSLASSSCQQFQPPA